MYKKKELTAEEKEQKRQKKVGLAKKLAELSLEQREALSMQIGRPVNPEGHQLSVTNTILIYFQGILNPTMVAGYQQWKKAVQVRKGEHGVQIRIPKLHSTGHSEENPEAISTADLMQTDNPDLFFLWVTVFDVSQTEESGKEEVAA